jgi:hypothetical protein
LKKPTGSVSFGFISLKPKKPNRTESKPKTQPEKNRAKPEKTEPNWFEPVSVWFRFFF